MHPGDTMLFHLSSVVLRGYKVAQLKSSNLKNDSWYLGAFVYALWFHLGLGNHIYCGFFLVLAVDGEVIWSEILC